MEGSSCGRSLGAIILGILIGGGLLGAGYFVAKGVSFAKKQDSMVSVKGLANREVKADLGIWEIDFKEVGDDLVGLSMRINQEQQTVIDFLKGKGFSESEMERMAAKVEDALANVYASDRSQAVQKSRYVLTAGVLIRSPKVDLIRQVSQQTGELLNKSIPLSFSSASYSPNPSFFYTQLDTIRPQMISEAVKSAKLVADQFAKDSGTELGGIRRANQGVFQIMSRNANENEGSQDQLSSVYKKVRLVTSVDYFLKRN